MEKRIENRNAIEVLYRPGDEFEIGKIYNWTKKYKYVVELKHKEADLGKIRVIKTSDKDSHPLPAEYVTWVFLKDLIEA